MAGEPGWRLILDAARALTDRGETPFTRSQLLTEVRRVAPTRTPASLGPIVQGMTANAPGGVPTPVAGALLRVDRGLYRLATSADDARGRRGDVAGPPGGTGPVGARRSPGPAEDVATAPPLPRDQHDERDADVVLIGCVKTKASAPRAAKDLFTSPLFVRRRQYAEASGRPWFILSAKHALVEPDDVLAPYDVYLPDQSPAYRRAWGVRVVERLSDVLGPLRGLVIEVHAGAAYVDPLRAPLRSHGAMLKSPLAGLRMGEQLAWYQSPGEGDGHEPAATTMTAETASVIAALSDATAAVSPADVRDAPRGPWRRPGLYSWWVDEVGAADLTAGLGHHVVAGLIYAGQAGATRWPSGRRSRNTLWGRLVGMHLGRRADFSTFRLTLAAALGNPLALEDANDPDLDEWMEEHLGVVVLPVKDADTLTSLEVEVLDALDPPLNLKGRPSTPLRAALRRARSGLPPADMSTGPHPEGIAGPAAEREEAHVKSPDEKAFHRAMVGVYERAKREAGYNATYFLRMLSELGGVPTAKLLLHQPTTSQGFAALYERRRLDLTVEALVLREPFRQLFTEEELKVAADRLSDLGYRPDAAR